MRPIPLYSHGLGLGCPIFWPMMYAVFNAGWISNLSELCNLVF